MDYPNDSDTPDVFHTRDRLGRATHSAQGTLTVAAGTLPVATGGIAITAIRSATHSYDPATLAPATEAVDYGGGFNQTLTRTYEDGTNGTISGRPNGYTFAGGSATWTYDNTGRPSTLTDGTDTFTYAYQPGSNLIKTVTGPAHTVTNTYEATRDVLASKTNAINDTNIPSSFAYGVNAIGQRETVGPVLNDSNNPISTYAPKWTWDYNDSGELIEANDQTASNDRAYQYDAIGNRQKTVNGLAAALPTAPTNYQANALNQYTVANGITLPIAPAPAPHDPDGNLRFDGGVNKDSENREYLWDAENRLIEVRVAGGAALVTYAYDHLSRLISRTAAGATTHYLYDGWNRIAEYSGQTVEKTYLWGMDLSGSMQGAGGVGGLLAVAQDDGVFYPIYDGNGNITEYLQKVGSTVSVVAHYEYDAFGNTISSGGSKAADLAYRFSTKPLDQTTGWFYYGYRWYDPLTGRWPSRDPIGEKGGVNLYGLVKNDPICRYDILGMHEDAITSHKVSKCEIYIYIGHSTGNGEMKWDVPKDNTCYYAYALACHPATANRDLPKEVLPPDIPVHDNNIYWSKKEAEITEDQLDAHLGTLVENMLASKTKNKNTMVSRLCDPSGCCCDKVTLRIKILHDTKPKKDWNEKDRPFDGVATWLNNNGYGGGSNGMWSRYEAEKEFVIEYTCAEYNVGKGTGRFK